MVRVIMTEEKFHELMKYYLEERRYGRLKYFWEISVPDDRYDDMLLWLERCEVLGFTFAFAVTERYKGHKMFYGFSNFEIVRGKGVKSIELNFDNSDVLYQHFMQWREESTHFIIPISVKLYLEMVKGMLDDVKFEEYDDYI